MTTCLDGGVLCLHYAVVIRPVGTFPLTIATHKLSKCKIGWELAILAISHVCHMQLIAQDLLLFIVL